MKNHLCITLTNKFPVTRKQTKNWNIIIHHMTKITHVKITHYPDDTKKTQMKAAPSPAFHTISTEHDWRAIYNCRRTGCRQLNVHLNQINRFIKNVFSINFYSKSIKFSHRKVLNQTFGWEFTDRIHPWLITHVDGRATYFYNFS